MAISVYWPNRPFGAGLGLGALFAVYAYYNNALEERCDREVEVRVARHRKAKPERSYTNSLAFHLVEDADVNLPNIRFEAGSWGQIFTIDIRLTRQ